MVHQLACGRPHPALLLLACAREPGIAAESAPALVVLPPAQAGGGPQNQLSREHLGHMGESSRTEPTQCVALPSLQDRRPDVS